MVGALEIFVTGLGCPALSPQKHAPTARGMGGAWAARPPPSAGAGSARRRDPNPPQDTDAAMVGFPMTKRLRGGRVRPREKQERLKNPTVRLSGLGLYLDPPKYLRKWDMTSKKQILVPIFQGSLRLQVGYRYTPGDGS